MDNRVVVSDGGNTHTAVTCVVFRETKATRMIMAGRYPPETFGLKVPHHTTVHRRSRERADTEALQNLKI